MPFIGLRWNRGPTISPASKASRSLSTTRWSSGSRRPTAVGSCCTPGSILSAHALGAPSTICIPATWAAPNPIGSKPTARRSGSIRPSPKPAAIPSASSPTSCAATTSTGSTSTITSILIRLLIRPPERKSTFPTSLPGKPIVAMAAHSSAATGGVTTSAAWSKKCTAPYTARSLACSSASAPSASRAPANPRGSSASTNMPSSMPTPSSGSAAAGATTGPRSSTGKSTPPDSPLSRS